MQNDVEFSIVIVDYEDSRLDFFREQREIYERKLLWWQDQKPGTKYSSMYIYDQCSKCGAAIAYFSDAIKMFEKR